MCKKLFHLILYLLSTQLLTSEKGFSNNHSLILAIKENNEERVEYLLQKGANPDSEDEHGNHSIHLAMEWDTEQENRFFKKRRFFPNIVKSLLKYKANPNIVYNFKRATPLHAAVFHNSTEIVIELLYYGAKKEVYDARGITPLDLAKHHKYYSIASILSINVPPAPTFAIEKEVESFYLIEIEKTPLLIDTSKPFTDKKIIDNYAQSIENSQ